LHIAQILRAVIAEFLVIQIRLVFENLNALGGYFWRSREMSGRFLQLTRSVPWQKFCDTNADARSVCSS